MGDSAALLDSQPIGDPFIRFAWYADASITPLAHGAEIFKDSEMILAG